MAMIHSHFMMISRVSVRFNHTCTHRTHSNHSHPRTHVFVPRRAAPLQALNTGELVAARQCNAMELNQVCAKILRIKITREIVKKNFPILCVRTQPHITSLMMIGWACATRRSVTRWGTIVLGSLFGAVRRGVARW